MIFVIEYNHYWKTYSDNPLNNASMLGHKKFIGDLLHFLRLKDLATPLTIGLNGKWGSGKTSIMMTIKTELEEDKDYDVIFFNAWKFEYSNPSIALLNVILSKYSKDNKEIKKWVKIAANIFSVKYLGQSLDDLASFQNEISNDNLSDKLNEILAENTNMKKLLIIIDDLDRCDIENTLQIITLVKLFLNLKNCVCITAVDFNRLEYIWDLKYHVDKKSEINGKSYLEKIFQIRIGVPNPSETQWYEYIESISGKINDEYVASIIGEIIHEPRELKLFFNKVALTMTYFRKGDGIAGQIFHDYWEPEISEIIKYSIIYWLLLEKILTQDLAVMFYNKFTIGFPVADFLKNLKNISNMEDERHKLHEDNLLLALPEEIKTYIHNDESRKDELFSWVSCMISTYAKIDDTTIFDSTMHEIYLHQNQ